MPPIDVLVPQDDPPGLVEVPQQAGEISRTSGATAISRAWLFARRSPEGSPLMNVLPSAVATVAARGEFWPAVAVWPVRMGPVRCSIAFSRSLGRLSHAMRFTAFPYVP